MAPTTKPPALETDFESWLASKAQTQASQNTSTLQQNTRDHATPYRDARHEMLFSSVYRFFLSRRSYVYEYALHAMLRKAVLRVDEDSVWERFGSVLQIQQYHARFCLEGLMSLPQTLRDNIYDLVAMAINPFHSEAYWLDMNARVMCSNPKNTTIGPYATASQLAGSFDALVEGDFCYVQGFAESLNLLSRGGNELGMAATLHVYTA